MNSKLRTIAVTEPIQIPEARKVWAEAGSWVNSDGDTAGSSATPSGTAMTITLDSVNFTLDRVLTPDAATMPNSARPAPPNTGAGIAATSAAVFGIRPRTTNIPPAAAVTQRDRTPVIDNTPMFWANAVYWKVLNTPPRTVAAPSARRVSAMRLLSISVSVISPMASTSPVASTIVTSDTMHMAKTAANTKCGAPK